MTKRHLMANPIVPAIIYTLIMTVGIAASNHIFQTPYATPGFTTVILLPLIVATTFTLWVAKTQNIDWVGQWKNWRAWAWVSPWLAAQIVLAIALGIQLPKHSNLWANTLITLVACLLVGIGEEVMFRAVVLKLAQRRVRIYSAMIVSAVLFSALHLGNILGGLSGSDTIAQLKDTLIFGLAAAPIAILSHTLIPLIVMHSAWDFLLLSSQNIAELKNYVGIASLVDQWWKIIAIVIAWTLVFLKHRAQERKTTA